MDVATEIRKLPPGILFQLVQILESGQAWKQLMAIVPKQGTVDFVPKYQVEHMKMIEQAGTKQKRPCAEIFLEEWGTSGRKRPDLTQLQELLVKAELFRAAEYIAVELLDAPLPERPQTGPAAPVDMSVGPHARSEPTTEVRTTYDAEKSKVTSSEKNGESLRQFFYSDLECFTGNFSASRHLGTGAFGSVFLGVLPSSECVAVKRLNRDAFNAERQFRNEIEALSRYRHPNLLPLLGLSCDGPSNCLVYAYMAGGSLEGALAKGLPPSARSRLHVALGTARGIHHLHKHGMVHRDVKSANVLLDGAMAPRLGDFGLVRLAGGASHTTTTVLGTSAYMAPEAFRGDVSPKLDTFSFGVVLLELLTGLPPYDEDRAGHDLVTYVEDSCDDDIHPLLDIRVDNWPEQLASSMFCLARNCLEDKRQRLAMSAVLDLLSQMLDTS